MTGKKKLGAALVVFGLGLAFWAQVRTMRAGDSVLDSVLDFGGSMGANMKTSQAGIAAIKKREGEVLKEYLDSAGLRTIGVGHLLGLTERYPNGITPEQSTALLVKDLQIAENAVNARVKVPLTQARFDALVSVVFNIGNAAFAKSSILTNVNKGDWTAAAASIALYNKVRKNGVLVVDAGLVNRRASEISQFA